MANIVVVPAPPTPVVTVTTQPLPPTVVVVSQGIPGPPGDLATPEEFAKAAEPIMKAHINDSQPHPAYDDLPDFTLMYENGLV